MLALYSNSEDESQMNKYIFSEIAALGYIL